MPRLLDLFCGAGGAAVGYNRAGFDEIVGVDNVAQARYPFEFVQADALEYVAEHGREFDAIHASPPCQGYSALAAMHPDRKWPMLIEPTQELLVGIDRPYVIENVETAPLNDAPMFGLYTVVLCGSMFGLGARGRYLRRHRLFQGHAPMQQPRCRHDGEAIGVYGHGGNSGKHRMAYRQEASEALGIDWMSRDEMTQAVPPAFTEFVGKQLLAAINA